METINRFVSQKIFGGNSGYSEIALITFSSAITIPLFANVVMRYGPGARYQSPKYRRCCMQYDYCLGALLGLTIGALIGIMAQAQYENYLFYS